MFLEVIDLPIVIAATPVAGAFALQRLWASHRDREELRKEANRAAEARREAMRVIHEALASAERAERARDQFLARMSHELRTPLNAVIGFARVLESNRAGNQRPQDLELLNRVRANGEHLLRLVEDVLEQARIARGHLTIAARPMDVGESTRRVAAVHAPQAAAKGLRFDVTVPDTPALVPLDGARFEQALSHLVENAIKFTATGSVSLRLVVDHERGPHLEVADTGVGIPADRLDEIFAPFAQVEESCDRCHEGAGLGLPLARQLCHAMGCRLLVESEVGRGSRFTICFPNPD